jgi:nucleoid-associated protein YgaU
MNEGVGSRAAALVIVLLAGQAGGRFLAAEARADPRVAAALELKASAVAAFDSGDYESAAALARRARSELSAAPAKAPLPARYVVRLVPGDRDCLSKIAGLPFVYGDRSKWTALYRANKATLLNPEDADLLLPGEVLLIPSLSGERREGSYDPGADYPDFASD